MSDLTRIVVGFDGSDAGRDALILGELLARYGGDEMLATRVVTDGGREDRAKLAHDLADLIEATTVPVEPLALVDGSPSRALHELAESDPDCDLLVLGSTHRAGLGRVLPGSVAERLLSGAPCAVAVAPRGFAALAGRAGSSGGVDSPRRAPDIRVIAVGLDGSLEAQLALERSASLASLARATLRVIGVGPKLTAMDRSRAAERTPEVRSDDLETLLHDVVAELPSELRTLPIFERGDPAEVLLARAEEGVDLLAVGSRGYGPIRSVLTGGVSAELVRRAPCPVLVTPRGAFGDLHDAHSGEEQGSRRS
ncbi:MAG: universal stress protein [Solirubrobacterales bacterium]